MNPNAAAIPGQGYQITREREKNMESRNQTIDVTRIIASFFVVLVHVMLNSH